MTELTTITIRENKTNSIYKFNHQGSTQLVYEQTYI